MDYKNMSIYQIYPRSFCDSNGDGIGDINGIISKLDYIASLGVNAIWFSPLYQSPNADFGYDISDYVAINPEYGTMEDFDRLLSEMHKRGLKCIMDLVINHTSSQHKWFTESRKSVDNPYRDYYFWRKGTGKSGKKPPNNWTSFFIGSAWKYDETTDEWYLHLFDVNQPDLNYQNPKVLQEIKDILKFWLDKGVDGFRCDVITILDKTPGLPDGKSSFLTGSEHYIDNKNMFNILKELKTDVLSKYDTFTVGESVMINVPRALRYISEDNQVLNTVFAFDHMDADNYFGVKQLVRKFSLKKLKKAHERWQTGLYGKAWNSTYFENHDQARIVGRYCSDEPQYRVLGAKMLATVQMCLSGTPFIYQGQEIGMTSIRMTNIDYYQDVEAKRSYNLMKKIFGVKKTMKNIAYASRDNARTPMQWNNSPQAGFSVNPKTWLKVNPAYPEINVENEKNDPDSVLNFYKRLLKIRKENKAMIFGKYELIKTGGNKLYCYTKEYEGQKILLAANFTKRNYKFVSPVAANKTELIISNYPDSPKELTECVLRPYETVVYKLL